MDQNLSNKAIWEVRDILSHSTDLAINQVELQLAKQIVASIKNNTNLTWASSNLSLEAQAKIQQLLRVNGFDLICYGLDIFPNSSNDLRILLEPISLSQRLSHIKSYVINRVRVKYFNFCYFLGKTDIGLTIAALSGAAYSLYVSPITVFWAMIISYFISNCVAILVHEYWVHDLIRPKNRIVGFFLDLLGHTYYLANRAVWRYEHLNHHRVWKTSRDPYRLWGGESTFWLFLTGGVSRNILNVQVNLFSDKVFVESTKRMEKEFPQYQKKFIDSLLPESKFLEVHWKSITLAVHVFVFLSVGAVNYFCFLLLQIWLFRRYILFFNELVTHNNLLTRDQEKDIPKLFFICCGTAYHKSHHIKPFTVILGPGLIKYANIQFYFVKLFYRLAPGAALS